jgi:DNA-binding XRE family transcriptional regulator
VAEKRRLLPRIDSHTYRERQARRRRPGPPYREPTTQLGARLRELREVAGLTQWELAELMGTPNGFTGRISDWELGYYCPNLRTLFKFASGRS